MRSPARGEVGGLARPDALQELQRRLEHLVGSGMVAALLDDDGLALLGLDLTDVHGQRKGASRSIPSGFSALRE